MSLSQAAQVLETNKSRVQYLEKMGYTKDREEAQRIKCFLFDKICKF